MQSVYSAELNSASLTAKTQRFKGRKIHGEREDTREELPWEGKDEDDDYIFKMWFIQVALLQP